MIIIKLALIKKKIIIQNILLKSSKSILLLFISFVKILAEIDIKLLIPHNSEIV